MKNNIIPYTLYTEQGGSAYIFFPDGSYYYFRYYMHILSKGITKRYRNIHPSPTFRHLNVLTPLYASLNNIEYDRFEQRVEGFVNIMKRHYDGTI